MAGPVHHHLCYGFGLSVSAGLVHLLFLSGCHVFWNHGPFLVREKILMAKKKSLRDFKFPDDYITPVENHLIEQYPKTFITIVILAIVMGFCS